MRLAVHLDHRPAVAAGGRRIDGEGQPGNSGVAFHVCRQLHRPNFNVETAHGICLQLVQVKNIVFLTGSVGDGCTAVGTVLKQSGEAGVVRLVVHIGIESVVHVAVKLCTDLLQLLIVGKQFPKLLELCPRPVHICGSFASQIGQHIRPERRQTAVSRRLCLGTVPGMFHRLPVGFDCVIVHFFGLVVLACTQLLLHFPHFQQEGIIGFGLLGAVSAADDPSHDVPCAGIGLF